ncbi:SGNH hydrolase domain-containing protein [Myroides odoratimimus subsp. xuanwuensis]
MRWDIQGLRAFAVLAVLADHLFHYPRGGFVGVDIFFAISGFLITGHLLHQAETTGIRWVDFYRRRIKRIIPAAALVLVVTVIASYAAFGAARADSIRTDSIWALLFGANFRFMDLETDYFNAAGPVSPLQHFWSLSIEEQFYFGWPILLLVVYAVLARVASQHARRIGAGIVMVAVVAASFAWAVVETGDSATRAYFDTFARVWELGVGALLAVCVPLLIRIPDALRPALAWVGVVGMTASLWLVTADAGFPAPAAAFPVLSAALVIAAGTFADRQRQQRHLFPLTNRLSNYVGDISYSLYLWHFPVIIVGATVLGESTSDRLVLLAVMAGLSALAYHLVEDPIRQSGWLVRKKERRGAYFPAEVTGSYRYFVVAGLVFITILLSASALRPVEPPQSFTVTAPTGEAGSSAGGDDLPGRRTVALQQEIAAALAATSWPKSLDPSMDDAIGSPQAAADILQCGGVQPLDIAACSWGSNAPDARTAVLVGDSVSMTYAASLREVFAARPGWRFITMGMFGCAFTDILIGNADQATERACPARKKDVMAAVRAIEPDLLFVSNVYEPRVPAGADDPLSPADMAASTGTILGHVRHAIGTPVILSPPPSDVEIAECYTPSSSPAECVSSVGGYWTDQAAADRAMIEDLGGEWLDASQWFCVEELCPAFVDQTPTKLDFVHMTTDYAVKIAPVMAEAFQRAGLLDVAARPASRP